MRYKSRITTNKSSQTSNRLSGRRKKFLITTI